MRVGSFLPFRCFPKQIWCCKSDFKGFKKQQTDTRSSILFLIRCVFLFKINDDNFIKVKNVKEHQSTQADIIMIIKQVLAINHIKPASVA